MSNIYDRFGFADDDAGGGGGSSENVYSQFGFADPEPAGTPEEPAEKPGIIDQLIGGYYDLRAREGTAEAIDKLGEAQEVAKNGNVQRQRGYIKGEPQFVQAAGGEQRMQATPEQRQAFVDDKTKAARESLSTAAEFGAKAEAIPLSPETQEFLNDNSDKTVWESFKAAPVRIILELGARSGASSAVSLGAGIGGAALGSAVAPGPGTTAGFAAGMGAASARLEYASSIVEALKARGVDVTDEASLTQAVSDEKLMQEIQKEATIRAGVIGGVDAIAGLVGAKHFTPGLKNSIVREFANLGVQAPAQAGLGAAGEAGAQLASGQELSPRQIAAEAAGEFVTAPIDVAGAAISGARSSGQAKVVDPDGEDSPVRAIERAQEQARQGVAAEGGDSLEQEIAAAEAGAVLGAQQDAVKQQLNKNVRVMQARADAEAEALAAGEPVKPRPAEAAFRADQRAQKFPAPAPDSLMGRRNAAQAMVDTSAEQTATEAAYAPQQAIDDQARAETQAAAAARYETTQGFVQAEEQAATEKTRQEAEAIGQREMQKGEEVARKAQDAPATLEDVAPRTLLERRRGDETIANASPSVAAQMRKPITVAAYTHNEEKIVDGKPKTLVERRAQVPSQEQKLLPAPKQTGFKVDSKGVASPMVAGERPVMSDELTLSQRREVRPRLSVQEINRAADEAATSPRNDLPEPTQAQKDAGNYKKGHVKLHGMDISIENPRGSMRSFTRPDGSKGTRRLRTHYGYVRRTEGADGDQLDIFVGDDLDSDKVYVIDQLKQSNGVVQGFDEHKSLAGFPSQMAAVRAYQSNYQPGWKVGPVKEMTIDEFNTWRKEGNLKTPLQPDKIPVVATQEQVAEVASTRKTPQKLRYAEEQTAPEKASVSAMKPRWSEKQAPDGIGKRWDFGRYGSVTREAKDKEGLQFVARREPLLGAEAHSFDGGKTSAFGGDANVAIFDTIDEAKTWIEESNKTNQLGAAVRRDTRKRLGLQNVKNVLAPLVKELPGIAPTVLDSPLDAPTNVRDQMIADGQLNARGMYDPDTDTVYVFAGNHANPEDALRTAVHEGVAHKGLRHLLRDKFDPTMRDIYENAKSGEWMMDFLSQHGLDATPENQVIAAEEYAASISEETDNAGVLQKLIAAVRKVLRSIGFVKEWSDNDIRGLLRASRTGLRDVSPHAKSAGKGLLYARELPDPRVNKAPESPLAVLQKQAATVEDQAAYNPGFVRSRMDAARDFGQGQIENLLAFIPRRNLPDFMAPGKMDSIRKYIRVAQRMDGRRNELLTETDETAKKWMKYTTRNKAGGRILGELMHAATLAGVDPSLEYKAIKDLKSMSAEDKVEDANRRNQYNILRRFWTKLDAEGKVMYTTVRNSYNRQREMIEKGLEDRINNTAADNKTKQALTLMLRQKFEEGRVRGPYFPLSRFGDYWAVAKTKDDEIASFSKFESPSEQRQWMAEMRKAGYAVDAGKKMEDKAMLERVDPTFVSKVTKLAEGVDAKLADEIWQLYLRSMPEMSMRKHFIHRKGRLGFSGDALRAYGNTMFHGAHQLAKLENMYQMEQHLDGIKKEAREVEQSGGPDAKWAAPLVKEMSSRHEWARNPMSSALASKLTSLGFAWYLGATPASAFVNMTQTAIVAFPTMAAKFNWVGAGSELVKAAIQYAGSRGPLANRLRGDERLAFDEAKRIGLFDQTQAHDLAGLASEGLDYTSRSRRTMEMISWFFHKAEEFNRQTTFLASYRLARKKGMSHNDAIELGEDLTWDSHFNYSNVNRARVLQSDYAKVFLLFRQYSANMTYRLARDFNDGIRGASPQIKKEARKRFGGILGMTGMFAGVTGMPMFWAVEMIVNAVFGDDDEPFDMGDATRAHLAEMYGPKAAEAIMKGPVDAASGATISNRVGLNNLWLREAPAGIEGMEYAMHLMREFAGPIPSIGVDIFAAASLQAKGYEERAPEKVMPKVAKDVAKTLRFMNEGITNIRGDAIMKKEEFTKKDAFLQAIGFTPADLTMRYEQNRAVKAAEKHILDRRAHLMDKLFLAARNEDRVGVRDAVADIATFGKKNPRIAINASNIINSAKTRARYSNEAVDGITVDPKLRYLHDELNFSREEK